VGRPFNPFYRFARNIKYSTYARDTLVLSLMSITHWKRALGLGFLSWLLPFVFSFLVFPLKQANAPLFDSVMAVAVVAVAGVLSRWYFRDLAARVGEAALLGFLWLAINLILDYPMFAYGPMRMSAARYYAEIGYGVGASPGPSFGQDAQNTDRRR